MSGYYDEDPFPDSTIALAVNTVRGKWRNLFFLAAN